MSKLYCANYYCHRRCSTEKHWVAPLKDLTEKMQEIVKKVPMAVGVVVCEDCFKEPFKIDALKKLSIVAQKLTKTGADELEFRPTLPTSNQIEDKPDPEAA